jgi:UTP--glucose-1-phosphate uridylyltransferase
MQEVRKAVIAAAGFGTRFLPLTKATPKEMLPIIDKPVIQVVVEGVVAAGVTDVIIVTGQGKRAIEDHFDRAIGLEQELRDKGKEAQAEEIQRIAEMANIVYVRQKGEPKGNARPVLNAAHLIDNEPFFYFFADDFFSSEKSTAQQMLESFQLTGKTIAALREVNREDASKYGMVELGEKVNDRTYRIKRLVEKPGPEKTPSNYAVVCGYLLTPDIIPLLAQENVAPDGEIRVPDSVNELAAAGEVYGCFIDGDYHDTGSPELYVQTIVDIALKDDKIGPGLREYLKDKL